MENSTATHHATTDQPRLDLHQKITDKILRKLEMGVVPWHQPWLSNPVGNFTMPVNIQSGNSYNGINVLLLWDAVEEKKYTSNKWGTYKQWKTKNQAVKKDEKGTMVIYYDTFEKEVEGEIKKIPFMKYSTVFNMSQLVDYAPEDSITGAIPKSPVEKIEEADTFVRNTGANIIHSGNKAFYRKKTDAINMPPPETFIDTPHASATEGYYSTLFHELTHWTGHESRIGRKFGKVYGDDEYAAEELICELGAVFMCSELEITKSNLDQSTAYLHHWIEKLKNNKHFITTAAGEASRATKYLFQLQPAI